MLQNGHLSEVLADHLQVLKEGELSIEQLKQMVDQYRTAAFDDRQKLFLDDFVLLAEGIASRRTTER